MPYIKICGKFAGDCEGPCPCRSFMAIGDGFKSMTCSVLLTFLTLLAVPVEMAPGHTMRD